MCDENCKSCKCSNNAEPKLEDHGVTRLPDGSAFAVASFPLPADHWLTADHDNIPPMPLRLDHVARSTPEYEQWRDAIRAAGKYAVRTATRNGKDDDFDPDALLQNLMVGFFGYHTPTGLSELHDNPEPVPPLFSLPTLNWQAPATEPNNATETVAADATEMATRFEDACDALPIRIAQGLKKGGVNLPAVNILHFLNHTRVFSLSYYVQYVYKDNFDSKVRALYVPEAKLALDLLNWQATHDTLAHGYVTPYHDWNAPVADMQSQLDTLRDVAQQIEAAAFDCAARSEKETLTVANPLNVACMKIETAWRELCDSEPDESLRTFLRRANDRITLLMQEQSESVSAELRALSSSGYGFMSAVPSEPAMGAGETFSATLVELSKVFTQQFREHAGALPAHCILHLLHYNADTDMRNWSNVQTDDHAVFMQAYFLQGTVDFQRESMTEAGGLPPFNIALPIRPCDSDMPRLLKCFAAEIGRKLARTIETHRSTASYPNIEWAVENAWQVGMQPHPHVEASTTLLSDLLTVAGSQVRNAIYQYVDVSDDRASVNALFARAGLPAAFTVSGS